MDNQKSISHQWTKTRKFLKQIFTDLLLHYHQMNHNTLSPLQVNNKDHQKFIVIVINIKEIKIIILKVLINYILISKSCLCYK